MAVIVGACGPGPLDPSSSGGELLTGTEDVAYLGGRPFSISPDRRWLVFSAEVPSDSQPVEDHVAFQLARLDEYVSYDLRDGTSTSVSVGDDVGELLRSGGGVLLGGGCWVSGDGGHRVLLRDSFAGAIGFDPAAESPTWEVVEIDRDELRTLCPAEGPVTVPSEVVGPFRIEGAGSRGVRIVAADDPSTVYAMHSAGALSTELLVGHVRLSDDGRRLAYTITPALGSFVSNARAFLVDVDDASDSAIPLAAPVYALEWAPDAPTLYAVVDRDGTMGIYRWVLGEPPALSSFRAEAPWTARVVENVCRRGTRSRSPWSPVETRACSSRRWHPDGSSRKGVRLLPRPLNHLVPQHADALDLYLVDVSRLHGPCRPHGAGPDQVAGIEGEIL